MSRDIKASRGAPARASGRFVLRIGPGLHAALRAAARDAGVSLNDYCARKLGLPSGPLAAAAPAGDAVARAAGLFGERLLGVVAYGSWARGEAGPGSDVDLLVVLDDRVALTRALYADWDAAPLTWGGRPVEAHFVHLPPAAETVAGLWAEVALDGIVLFERGLRLSARLAAIRRDVAAGRIVRREAHGQPYWTTAA
jgi:predicted nucleotidyltransferase